MTDTTEDLGPMGTSAPARRDLFWLLVFATAVSVLFLLGVIGTEDVEGKLIDAAIGESIAAIAAPFWIICRRGVPLVLVVILLSAWLTGALYISALATKEAFMLNSTIRWRDMRARADLLVFSFPGVGCAIFASLRNVIQRPRQYFVSSARH